tara:strand:+ start:14327 stop:18802 length:4476 start_codon:yes stop_codon:yes gene_type:complete
MNVFDKFERFGQKTFNGQDILKNHILTQYPKVYTKNIEDYAQVSQYAETTDYVWLVEEGLDTLRSFPWWFKPSENENNAIHQFPYVYKASKRIKSYTKVQLVPTRIKTDKIIKQKYICGSYDVYCGKDMFDIFFIGDIETGTYSDLIGRFKNIKIANDHNDAQQRSTTDMFWVVPDDVIVSNIFKFNFTPDDWSLNFTHIFGNGTSDTRDGIALFPKYYTPTEKELTYRYYANKKELTVVASKPRDYPIVEIKSYADYELAIANTASKMFWYVPDDVEVTNNNIFKMYFDHQNQYDRNTNHVFLNNETYDGIVLFSKNAKVTEKEFTHRFYANKKEHEVVASLPKKFDQFVINNYKDYELAKQNSTTEMFWGIPSDVNVNFNFELYFDHHNQYDRNITHVFLNDKTYDGIVLFSKTAKVTEKEVTHRFYARKKEWNVVASTPKSFDLFEIDSYNQYLAAFENSKTEMFWASSANIKTKDFEDFYISHHEIIDRRQNHSFIHKVGNTDYRNGLFLLSKHKRLSKNEIEHRFIINAKEWDMVFSHPAEYNQFNIETYNDYLDAMEKSKTEMFWATTPNVNWNLPEIYFTHDNDYDRKQNHAFIHRANSNDMYNGVFLLSKNKPITQKEIEYRHLVERKEWDIVASNEIKYNIFCIDTYNEYLTALDNSETEMFWGISKNINVEDFKFNLYFTHDNEYDRKQNHSFIHRVNNKDYRNGVFLFSKYSVVTEKEIEHRFIVNAKEWNIVASGPAKYDHFIVDTYNEYLTALDNSETEMFWATSRNLSPNNNFKFDLYFTHDNEYDRKQSHAFIHRVNDKDYYNGIFLFSKSVLITEKEIEHRFIANRKEWNIVASGPAKYDHFIVDTYNEYITALETSTTELFWATSRNISIDNNFNFDLYFTHDNEYDRKQNHSFIHKVNDKDYRNGVFLFSKYSVVTEKEIEHRFVINAKEWDVVASKPVQYNKFNITTYNDYLTALDNSETEMFYGIPNDVYDDFEFNLYFTHNNEYDRKTNHVFLNGKHRDGIVLFSKHAPVTQREVENRFYVNKKDWDVVASTPKPYDLFFVETYNDYLDAIENSTTDLFWATTYNIQITEDFKFDLYFSHHNSYDRKINHTFIHRVNGEDLHNGLFLLSKHALLTQKEIEHRLIAKRKEWDIVASNPILYDRFAINTYDDYLTALETSKTEMFWMIPPEVNVEPSFKFDLYFTHNQWFERETNHVFMNGTAWDGIALVSKKAHVTEREIRMRFLTNKKQYDVVASTPTPYDIVFISKDEEHADASYANLTKRFPRAMRVHGVEGIHAAHIEAAKLCDTDLIWIVDADAEIIDKFNFDYYVPAYDPDSRKTVHVWKSQNPVNSLVYGYGAVKLLPRDLTLNMDTSKPDMTTSISPLFKSINRISNITKFNTDEFSTWRSAFRECVKLSARAIDGQLDEETEFRLGVWCSRGKDKPFGEYCIAGANAGKAYGEANRGNLEALRKINDFDWLRNKFDNLENSL